MSDRLTTEQLDQLDAALEAMTPPPWETDGECEHQIVLGADGVLVADCSILGGDRTNETCTANAVGIALLRNQARALVAAARENERLRGALEEIASRENWGIGEHEGNDATVWQGDSAPFDIARAALGEQR